ncbi:S66 family peptidase [Anaerocolumna xylanovorans]|nr:S66 peptidase family protein [Anaerocolumna xylanovorans]
MKDLIIPKKLKKGDKVALISLSSGIAGDADVLWRYEQGKARLKEVFGLEAVEMEHTLSGTEYICNHPEERAKDLLNAFRDPSIKGIISCIGGIESIRMLPYLDLSVIRENPKVFLGYSDTTTSHLICYKAGISSIYGPCLLVDFAENVKMHPYTAEYLKRALFDEEPMGEIKPAPEWTSEYLPWELGNKYQERKYSPNKGYEVLQGTKNVRGRLLGGCLEVFDMLRGTELFPSIEEFEDTILFFETSEEMPPVWYVECALRMYGMMGIFERTNGILWAKPYGEKYYEEYKEVIKRVLKEFGKESLPVLYNVNFGHTEPKIAIPYGTEAVINCKEGTLTFL